MPTVAMKNDQMWDLLVEHPKGPHEERLTQKILNSCFVFSISDQKEAVNKMFSRLRCPVAFKRGKNGTLPVTVSFCIISSVVCLISACPSLLTYMDRAVAVTMRSQNNLSAHS